MSELTDTSLVERAAKGDVDAFRLLVERYKGLVFGVAFHLLGEAEGARDVAQDVFIRAWLRLGQLRDSSKVGSWLRQVAANECRSWIGRQPRLAHLDEDASTIDPVSESDNRLLLAAALNSIDEASRLTVILFYLHAYSIKEIADFLDEPTTTIKSRLRNARTKLRRRMEDVLESNLSRESLPEEFAARVARLLGAVKSGDEDTIRSLLQADPGLVSANDEPGRHSPLHIAAGSGDTAVVELLLSYGANPNALDEGDNASPLHHAAERGRLEVVKLLLAAGADINWDLTVHQASPLGWATMFEPTQVEVAEYLIAQGANVDIFSAIALGYRSAVQDLVERDPIVLRQRMSRCERFRSPIEFATERRQFEIARLLAELGSEITLAEAAGMGLVELVSSRLQERPAMPNLLNALQAAVRAGQIETARLLLQSGTDPNYAPQGTSLIFDAIGANDRPMAELLIDFGADLEFKDHQWKSSALGWQVFFARATETQLAIDLGSIIDSSLLDLALAGERGEIRRFSPGTPAEYRAVHKILKQETE
jgi:RNA polymerase sigma-70 factor (ECF subfamily)